MKKINIIATALLSLTLGLTSCGDVMDEIESLVLDRNMSPVELTAKVRNRTNVELSWNASSGANLYKIECYANDSLNFEGVTPTETVTTENTTYTFTGLEGETDYSFRVQALTDGDTSRDSKWSAAYAQTSAEQIFNEVASADLKARQVTITWPKGEAAKNIVVSHNGEVVVDHALTADEIAAGSVTITGLEPETTYTAIMYRASGKQRGKVTFKTAIELLDNDILVEAGADLASIVAGAADGSRLVIMPGTYVIPSDADGVDAGALDIDKDITFKGLRANDHPVINGRFTVSGGKKLAFEQVTLDGKGTSGDQGVNFKEAGDYDELSFNNCEIKNYTKGAIYVNVATDIKNITIDNCIYSNIECDGGDMFDCRKGVVENFSMTNTTVYNSCASRDLLRFDDSSKSFAGKKSVVLIDHCTLDGIEKEAPQKGILYVRFGGTKGNVITFTNNLVTNSVKGKMAGDKKVSTPTYKGNHYFNCSEDMFKVDTAAGTFCGDTDASNGADPQYKDAAKGNFTVGNLDVTVGDPRWQTAQ